VEQLLADWHPDLVLREPCEYASAVAAHGLGIRTAQVAISLAHAEAGAITTAAPALEAHRPGLTEELRCSEYLTRFPSSLDPSPFAATVRYREPNAPRGQLPDWWGGSDAPLVYLTFGTVLGHMTIAPAVYETAMRAVAGLGCRVLLTIGRQVDPASLGPVPMNVHIEPWVDQADVFARARLVVCHGGSGTMFGALAAGIPVVAVPLFADQFENSRLLGRSGAGVVVETPAPHIDGSRSPIGMDDAPRITEAISVVLASSAYRRRAGRIAAEVAAAPTADEVVGELLRVREARPPGDRRRA
jgi:UDP:flavonoid glycosyltransferase YjiC (YdhE family)